MSVRKPDPLNAGPTRKVCPVCHKPSYSSGGTHPQCAVARSDAAVKAAQKAAAVLAGALPQVATART